MRRLVQTLTPTIAVFVAVAALAGSNSPDAAPIMLAIFALAIGKA
jgi:hypothetical protein